MKLFLLLFNCTRIGTVSPNFSGMRANGTLASPSAVNKDDNIVALGGRGYGSTGFVNTSSDSINIKAAQNFTATANGTYMTFETVPLNVAALGNRVERMHIDAGGNIAIGTTTPHSLLEVSSKAPSVCLSDTNTTLGQNNRHGCLGFNNGAFSINFPTDNFSSTTTGISLTNTGFLGIGTSSPTSLLTLDGTGTCTIRVQTSGTLKGSCREWKDTSNGNTYREYYHNGMKVSQQGKC